MMYGSWDIKVWRTIFFVMLGHFFPFDPPKNLKNQNFEKHEKNAWRYHHFTLANHKWWSYNVWSLRYGAQQTEFLTLWTIFCPLTPFNNPENQNFEKKKKTLGNIIILHKCTINENHMVYDSWDMEHDRHNFFSFWAIFCRFTPLTTQKIKILKKKKKTPGDIIIFHKCTINDNHMMYGSWDMQHDRIFVILSPFFFFFFALLPHYWLWKLKFGKNVEKKNRICAP